MKVKDLIYISIIVLILIALGCNANRLSSQLKERTELISSMNDTLKVSINKNNEQVAKISILETVNIKSFIQLKTLDESIKELQTLVKANTKRLKEQGSVTVLKNETKLVDRVVTKVLLGDTIIKDSITYIYPQYVFDIKKDKWVEISGISNKDTTIVDLKIVNEYSVIIGKEKEGLFKKAKPFVEVTNKNPYSSTTSLRTYQVSSPKVKRFGIGPQIGYGINFSPSGNIQHGFSIGVGVNYNLIRF